MHYNEFKKALMDYVDTHSDRASQLTYALYLLGKTDLSIRSSALGFIQGFLGIAPCNF